jgi:ribosome-associated protein
VVVLLYIREIFTTPLCYNWLRTGLTGKGDTGGFKLEANELAHKIVEIAEDRKAEDIVLLDIHKLSIIADYFVICTGTSDRHVKAIANELDEKLGEMDINPVHVEGLGDAKWVLMDYNYVLVHIFDRETRDFYKLEQLWSGATPVLVVQ